MKAHRIALVCVPLAACLGVGMASLPADDLLSGVRGGERYDKWWVAAGLPAPTGDHPLYPDIGQKSGPDTWRCKECHGWDYKGAAGAYGSGSHYTGIGGVFGSTLTEQEMFDLLKFNHGFENSGMSDEDYGYLVSFLQNQLIDTDDYIDANKAYIGDTNEGRYGYFAAEGAYACVECHGPESAEVRDLAVSNPWEVLHKIRIGHPGSYMPSWLLGGNDDQGAVDIGAYIQADYPEAAYAGDMACATCHADYPETGFFDAYKRSGHPWKIFHTAGEVPADDTWPWSAPPPLPVVHGTQLEWSDVEYVIGNYRWKARFIDRNGYIHTGDVGEKTQWNLASETWVGYHAGQADMPFDCGRCHTTGYSPEGNQLGLPGLIGTWTEDGVRCEACHGPSSDHVAHADQMLPPGGKDCAECHYRDSQNRMPWKSGFMEHHQQSEDFTHSPHSNLLECVSCHEPHKSTVYSDGGMVKQCTECHEGDAFNNNYVVAGMETVECVECHMPYMGKNADTVNQYMGDIRGHLFQILRKPVFAADNVYTEDGKTFWNQNEYGEAFVTLDYACLGCHEEINQPLTMQEAFEYATRIHQRPGGGEPGDGGGTICDADFNGDGVVDSQDVIAFLGAWARGDAGADMDGSGTVDIRDFMAFLNLWSAGCP